MRSKKVIHKETMYLLAVVILALSVSLVSAADFGLSMIAAPAYLVGQALGLTFGQGEYIVEGILFVIFCLIMKKCKVAYFCSFLTGIFYGTVLDLWRSIPILSQATIDAGTLPMATRIVFFTVGELLTGISVAMFFQAYFYPAVYDFFVKGITAQYNLPISRFKLGFDCSMLVISITLSLVLFHGFVGIGIGTLIMCAVNGPLIGFMDRTLHRFFTFQSFFPKWDNYFLKQIYFTPKEDHE